jgi:pimeloyl-ACP methyl ester carboxylesterase
VVCTCSRSVEAFIKGLAPVDTAPDAGWFPPYVAMIEADSLAEVTAAAAYAAGKPNVRLAELAVASAPWNFSPSGLDAGRELLMRMPYNQHAVEWSHAEFDHVYVSSWWPTTIPALLVAGSQERIVSQSGWNDPAVLGRSRPSPYDRESWSLPVERTPCLGAGGIRGPICHDPRQGSRGDRMSRLSASRQ